MNRTLRAVSPCAMMCAALGGLALIVASCPAARAADADEEIATAAEHANFAAESTAIGMVHAHLHHTINCLVGPKGEGFDAKELNPCEKLGNGAIPDTTDAATVKSLRQAVALAQEGLKSNDLEAAKKLAAEVEAELNSGE
jgi:hypothetical protein